MATRRPPPSRSKSSLATLSTKPRNAIPKSTSGITSPTEERMESQLAASILSHKPHGKDDAETHIQVVIRCRRRSDREVQEGSPIVVSSKGPKSQDVTIETSAPISSFGVVTLPPTKTYPFDTVFGPEADQAMIYHDVVSPMLDEVLMGYNCTLFAYGQTGTGKTYTMQGDLTPTPMGNPSVHAGMIPRVLFRLFHQLETSAADYSVKISFIELYNEELRDLLASELSAPAGSTQPMGKGGQADNQGGLKIFDDASKKGVFIQGLEEMPVKDAADALALLTKGSHRRQIAATKFNDHSSRSHSVFSITVHTKETSAVGDDLLKVGKLNLVDLAGSENIGRSGAENKRAREAGMINQSLLTLGRVINALVDRSSHVPYRESKLTRLLQDSLGGRTKTCIIATISPARSNMEETLSTLEYALRAKSIRNKPEINQRMTRNSLLKEYVAEIERLKADVLAAREKNGIFFSEETWNQLSAEQELKQTEMEEAKKQVEIVESQLRSVREEFEQSIGLLMKRDGELKETKEKLKETEVELEAKDGQLKAVKGALEEEIVVRQVFQVNEGKLDSIACGLKQVASETIDDVGALFEKISRTKNTFNSNVKAVSSHGKSITVDVQFLSEKIDEFTKLSGQSAQNLRAEVKQHQAKELEILSSHSERIDLQLQRMQDSLKVIGSKDDVSMEALKIMQKAVSTSQETMKSSFAAWSEGLRSNCQNLCQDLVSINQINFTAVEDALKAMGSLVDSVVSEALEFMRTEGESFRNSKGLADEMTNSEIARLQSQNTLLVQMLDSEKTRSDKAKDELVHRMSSLLKAFVDTRDTEIRQAFGAIATDNAKAEERIANIGQQHDQLMDGFVARGGEATASFERRGSEGKRTRDGALKSVASAQTAFKDALATMQTSVATTTTTYSGEIQRHNQSLNAAFGSGFDRHSRAKKARIESTNTLVNDVQSDLRHLQRGMASSSRNVEGFTGKILSESSSLTESTQQYHDLTSSKLSSLQQTARALVEQGTRDDIPTGLTPRKRVREYVDQWELTKSREDILSSWKHGESSGASGGVLFAEYFRVPEETEEEMKTEEDSAPSPTTSTSMDLPSIVSLSSSVSSTDTLAVAPPIPPPITKKTVSCKSGLPIMGALVDRPTNILGNRGSRRR
ncbi:P-loop containing nucleoside triphosphate hydrolase protein [Hygrophoropsis aurantiaca]|uniref:P-loop containing nucleoside triphosphate hydrolase protein n=1 Tax=Hygrophoropsis aurantiaca TaxID=72124 RepID=A0ACB8APQ3_9AGAM|nr:P-loop containing nucleoside triphosphate hydrolase protein [Hygrophoropsis aurantiaca]